MSLLDQLGAAATAVGQGVVDAAKWGYGQTAGPQEAAYQKSVLDRQQASAQAAQDRQDQQDLFRAAQDGWVPADSQKRLPGGLIDRTQPSSANQDPSRIQVIGGKRMYNPTDQEKGKSFVPTGQLGDALKTAGWDGKTPVTPEQSHSVIQALNEAQPKDEPYDIDTSGRFQDAQGKPAAVMVGRKTGKVRLLDLSGGSQSSTAAAVPGGPFDTSDDPGQPGMQSGVAPANGAAPGGPFSFAPQEKAEKADVSQIVPGIQGPNGGLVMFNKTDQSTKEVPLPPGSKPVMTAAQTEADKDRHVSQDRLAEDRATRLSAADQAKADKAAKAQAVVQQKHDDYQSQEKDQWNLKGWYDKLLDPSVTPDGTTVTLPSYNAKTGEINEGRIAVMNKDLRGGIARLSSQSADKAMDNQESARKIRKSMGWGEFAPAQTTTQKAPQKPAQPVAAPVAPAPKQTARQLPTGHKVGDTVKLKTGQTVKIKQVYQDGTFDY